MWAPPPLDPIRWERFQKSPERFGEDVRERLGLGLSISGVELALQLDRMKELRSQLLATFDRVDIVVTPTTEDVPPLISESAMIPTTARFYATHLALESCRQPRFIAAGRDQLRRAPDRRPTRGRSLSRRPATQDWASLPVTDVMASIPTRQAPSSALKRQM